jgi:putative SOS response-associated peptidase YedK
MCGRYEIADGKRILIHFQAANVALAVLPNLDVRPTQQVPVLLADHELTLMKWELVPAWAKDASIGSRMINARRGDRRQTFIQATAALPALPAARLRVLRVYIDTCAPTH